MTNNKTLKLFVWEGVLVDYSDGIMFAFAHDIREARALLRKKNSNIPESDLKKKPKLVTDAEAFLVWGGD